MFLGEAYEAVPEEHESDPSTYEEAMTDIDSDQWKLAMKAEMESMYSNQVWELVDSCANIKPIWSFSSIS